MISIFLLSALFATLHGCTSSSPENSVKGFLEAAYEGNEKKMARWTWEGTITDYRGGERFVSQWGARFQVKRFRMEERIAVAVVEFEVSGESVEIPYVCMRRGGKWKVALRETMRAWEEGI